MNLSISIADRLTGTSDRAGWFGYGSCLCECVCAAALKVVEDVRTHLHSCNLHVWGERKRSGDESECLHDWQRNIQDDEEAADEWNFGTHFEGLIAMSGGFGVREGMLVDRGEIENYLIMIGKKEWARSFCAVHPAPHALSHASCECGLILGEDSQNSTVSVFVPALPHESLPCRALTLTSQRMLTQ